jgi:hypothetical protein
LDFSGGRTGMPGKPRAHGMPSQQPFQAAVRALHHPSKESLTRSGMAIKLDSLPAAHDCRNSAQHFAFDERRIVSAKSVAARDQEDRRPALCFIHQPVRVEAAIPDEQHNVSAMGALGRLGPNNESVSGEYGGNHAGAPGHEPKFAERSQHFRCEVCDNILAPVVGLSAHGNCSG